ncbi:MAG: 4Fe-4S dicluster domain-containing protein [Candidatus Zixiibacteriota bacterium]|nr:MAG: 4Fe-4S dicluster domain-containing protein [candidate division Zixibacteria bacterium]
MDENPAFKVGDQLILQGSDFSELIVRLKAAAYRVVGPMVRDGCIVFDEISGVEDLPAGFGDNQDAATYRLRQCDDMALFGYNNGPQSVKRFLYTPQREIWKARRNRKTVSIHLPDTEPVKTAFLGVRPCDLNAVLIQDRVFTRGEYLDDDYNKRRENSLIIVVNCTEAGKTCFCSSMNTGPRATAGFDLALTEILHADHHYFLLEVGSDRGLSIVAGMPCDHASDQQLRTAAESVTRAADNMGRSIDASGLKELLIRNIDNVYWDSVGHRCLTCANCTMVCPTCFCSTVEDTTDLTGNTAHRIRRWDSCFTMDFSYIHGGSVRPSAKARYRQWIIHKLASWHEQFGTSGCVGCGRCITWCPVGIDITEEARAIRQRDIRPAEVSETMEV